jgi:outer membrane protein OmpA-like peptidoglycan-associated protein
MQSLRPLILLLALAACATSQPTGRKYLVFFEANSTELDAPARGAIAEVAQRAHDYPSLQVVVTGFTDTTGAPQSNVVLSQQRAKVVADTLVADGVPPAHIVRRGHSSAGEDPTIASRRVEISFTQP